jgi:hypothetical protein
MQRALALLVVLGAPACGCPARPVAPAAVAAPSAIAASSAAPGVPHPVVRQQNYLLEAGPYALEVNPTDGGRIVAFSLDGRSVVAPRSESPEAYGSSFWPSPQSDWKWPPPVEFDGLPWQVQVDGATLVLQSGTHRPLGLSAVQRITLDAGRGAATIEYQLQNHGPTARRVAPWQNTRVRPRGLTFYPSSEPALPQSSLKLAPVDGIVWFAHDPSAITENVKLWADGAEGWLAQVDGDLLFVKVFPDVPRAAQAPGESDVVIYVQGNGGFVEVEQQGAYEEIAPGASSSWTVHWVLRRLPRDVEPAPGNPKLVALARELAASVR